MFVSESLCYLLFILYVMNYLLAIVLHLSIPFPFSCMLVLFHKHSQEL
uniref:Uncharacterized protein n=1 Tax=Rhizophora mucronata TaxID=61149 RepID=A0A2P2P670_RHIMU